MSDQPVNNLSPQSLRMAIDEVRKSRAAQYEAELRPAHQRYVDTVSEKDVAASLETSVMLMVLCRALSAQSVLDLGSGFSTYVFRHYKQKYNPGLRVRSVDTDRFWLDMSRHFCELHKLDEAGFMLWEETGVIKDKFDLILLDIQDYPTRQGYLPEVIQRLCHPGSVILLDDMHWPRYSAAIFELLAQRDYSHLNLKAETLDEFGRFANLICGLGNQAQAI